MPKKPDSNGYSQQLAMLREFTSKYGTLHEAQVLQLKIWPRLAFPHATPASKTDVDLEKKVVRYRVATEGRVPGGSKSQKVRTQALLEQTQWLLGNDWEVQVTVNGGAAQKLARKKAVEPRKYAGTDFEAGRVVPETPWKPKTLPSLKPR